MNTFVLTVVGLACAQAPPSQFAPDQVISPVQAAPMTVESTASERGGSFRFADEAPVQLTTPAAEVTEPPSQPPSRRNWNVEEPRPTATRAQAQAEVVPVHSHDSDALAAMILDGAIDMRTRSKKGEASGTNPCTWIAPPARRESSCGGSAPMTWRNRLPARRNNPAARSSSFATAHGERAGSNR